MVVLGIDAHKRTHTVVAVDEVGRQLGVRVTRATSTAAHLELVVWADRFGADRRRAVEDCRHLSRRLERDLLAAGEVIVRVPPEPMAHARDSARRYGRSDPVDALAVARAALREPGLPAAWLDGPGREVRLLAGHREDLVAERTRAVNRLRWHLHELDPSWDPRARSLSRRKNLDQVAARLAGMDGMVARIAAVVTARAAALTAGIAALEKEITGRARQLAPSLLALPGAAELTTAKIVAETAGAGRFRSKDARARRRRCRPGQATRTGTACPAPATGSSTAPSTGSPSPRNAAARRPGLPEKPHHRRRHTHRGAARSQTADLRRRLPRAARRYHQPGDRHRQPGCLT